MISRYITGLLLRVRTTRADLKWYAVKRYTLYCFIEVRISNTRINAIHIMISTFNIVLKKLYRYAWIMALMLELLIITWFFLENYFLLFSLYSSWGCYNPLLHHVFSFLSYCTIATLHTARQPKTHKTKLHYIQAFFFLLPVLSTSTSLTLFENICYEWIFEIPLYLSLLIIINFSQPFNDLLFLFLLWWCSKT